MRTSKVMLVARRAVELYGRAWASVPALRWAAGQWPITLPAHRWESRS